MLKKIVLSLVVLILAAVIAVSVYFNSLVVKGVETFGSKYLGVDVTLEDADVSLLSGNITLNGLVVGSPKGFQASHTFSMETMTVSLDMRSLLSDVVKIYDITIKRPHIVYELGRNTTNVKAIQSYVQRAEQKVDSRKQSASSDTPKASKRVEIDKVNITGGVVEPAIATVNTSIKMPDILLTNIGKEGQSVSFAKATMMVVNTLVSNVVRLDVKSLINSATEQFKGAVDGRVKDTVKGVSDSLKGMLGGDK